MGIRSAIVVCVLLACAFGPASAAADTRLMAQDLSYRGAFLLPSGDGEETFAYGGTALAADSKQDSLFAVGHDWYQLSAEVTTPRPVRAESVAELPSAAFRQAFTDATDGKIDATGGDGNKIGGQLVYRDRLYGSVYIYYDAAGEQVRSHFRRPSTSLSGGGAEGLFEVGDLGAGFVSGYMAEVPRAWRKRLGGPALTGNCSIPIISRSSYGPAAAAFDPAKLGGGGPVPDTPLVHYPHDNPALGDWDDSWDPEGGVLFNGGTSIRGLVFPRSSRSVLFIGSQGTGAFCYGSGTDDPSLHGRPTPDGTIWCYDPDESSKGTHAYPYAPRVWAYDAADLRAVRKGKKQPWQVKPYATWELELPFGSDRIGGAAYDGRRGLIYVSQQLGEEGAAIHVFRVK